MAAVVNLLHFKDPVDPSLFTRATDQLGYAMRAVPGFEGFDVVQTSDHDVVLLIFADSEDTLNRLAGEIGGPWMVENIVPLLDGPPQRHIGPTLASVRR